MSVPVNLINRGNSQPNKINFTRSKLSKNIESDTKSETNLCSLLKSCQVALRSLPRTLRGFELRKCAFITRLSPRDARFSAPKILLVVKFWWS